MSPFQTRAPVQVTKAGDPNQGQAGVALSYDEVSKKVSVQLDAGGTWLFDPADLRAL